MMFGVSNAGKVTKNGVHSERGAAGRKRRGFTMIELLIVMTIIGVMAGAVVMITGSGTKRSYDTTAMNSLKNIAAALNSYYSVHMDFPGATGTDLSGLRGTYIPPNKFGTDGVGPNEIADPWGQKIQYVNEYDKKEGDGNVAVWILAPGDDGADYSEFGAAKVRRTYTDEEGEEGKPLIEILSTD